MKLVRKEKDNLYKCYQIQYNDYDMGLAQINYLSNRKL